MLDEQAGRDHAALHGLVLQGLQVPEWQIISLGHRGGNVEPVPHLPTPENTYFLDFLDFLEYFLDFLEYFPEYFLDYCLLQQAS